MNDLILLFESYGFKDVFTYIQSGNILFKSEETDTGKLKCQIEDKLLLSLGYEVIAFVLTPENLKKAAADNPFKPEGPDTIQCHIMFLSGKPDEAHRDALMEKQGDEYRFSIQGNVLYYEYPIEFAGTRRNVNFEKILGVTGTARTWKVVNRLIELTS